MDKNQLRKKLLEIKIDENYNKKASHEICKVFLSLDCYKNAKYVFCFVGRTREIQTDEIIHKVLDDKKILCVPYCTVDINGKEIMLAKEIKNIKELKQGKYGILTPDESAKTIAPHEIDIAILPCLAADKNGARLGFGKGYYDKFLINLKKGAVKIALCREIFIQKQGVIPMQKHDVFANFVISEKKFYEGNLTE